MVSISPKTTLCLLSGALLSFAAIGCGEVQDESLHEPQDESSEAIASPDALASTVSAITATECTTYVNNMRYVCVGDVLDDYDCLAQWQKSLTACSGDVSLIYRSYVGSTVNQHYEMPVVPGYYGIAAEAVFSLAATPQLGADSAPIYHCQTKKGGDMLSKSSSCNGYPNDGVAGYSMPPDGNRPIYQCQSGPDSFISYDSGCEGAANYGVLAYGRPDVNEYLEPLTASVPAYTMGFETSEEFQVASAPQGWNIWQNCNAGGWSAGYYDTSRDNPAPGGGRQALRLHTTNFTAGCAYPGVYAESRSFSVAPGRTYAINGYIRNGASLGTTEVFFYDASNQLISMATPTQSWNSDTWQYNAETAKIVVAPAGATNMRLRYRLYSPNAYADIDLIRVDVTPLPGLIYSNSFNSTYQWTLFHTCAANNAYSIGLFDTSTSSPVLGAGKMALRMHTTSMVAGCQWPGAYADSPKINVVAGNTYVVENFTRNGGSQGLTEIYFIDGNNQYLWGGSRAWAADSWQFNADDPLALVAPASAKKMFVRYLLQTPNAYADIDALRISVK